MTRRGHFRQLLLAGGLSAGAMYFLDSGSGRNRRAHLLDRGRHALLVLRRALSIGSLDLSHRMQGAAVSLARPARGVPPDDTLLQHVRASIGRVVGHPHAIHVEVIRGRVILRGAILANEVEPLLIALRHVAGITEVVNELDVQLVPGDVSSLQGRGRRHLQRPPGYWTPAARLLLGTGGACATILGGIRRDGTGIVLRLAGIGLLIRAASNLRWRQIVGLDREHGFHFHRTVKIDAPPEAVFEFLDDVRNLSRFMSDVRDVKDLGNDRSEWVLALPAGMSISWQAVRIERIPNRLLAWASVPGAIPGSATWIRLEPTQSGGTRLDIQLAYSPPAGALGYLLGKLLGADPRRALDKDLLRLKSLMEIGKTSVRGHVELREDIAPMLQ